MVSITPQPSGSLDGLGKGARVFVRVTATAQTVPKESSSEWEEGELVSVAADGAATVTVSKGRPVLVAPADVAPANPTLQDGIPDIVQLSFLTEPGILHNLSYRSALGGLAGLSVMGRPEAGRPTCRGPTPGLCHMQHAS
jgi:hypothetical protein